MGRRRIEAWGCTEPHERETLSSFLSSSIAVNPIRGWITELKLFVFSEVVLLSLV